MVAGLVGKSVTKGLLSGAIGLVITMVGPDPIMGVQRFTMGIHQLEGGFPFLPVLIGIFAFAQLMPDVEQIRHGEARQPDLADQDQPRGVASAPCCGTSSAGRSSCCG